MKSTRMKVTRILTTVFCLTVLMALAHDTNAATIRRVRCRTRTNPARVQITVDAQDLAVGQVVTATIANLRTGATADSAFAAAANVEGDVGFVFESANVVAPATAIAPDFALFGDTVSGAVKNNAGAVIASGTIVCQ